MHKTEERDSFHKKLTAEAIGKYAWRKVPGTVVMKVPKDLKVRYRKWFIQKGLNKKAVFKGL